MKFLIVLGPCDRGKLDHTNFSPGDFGNHYTSLFQRQLEDTFILSDETPEYPGPTGQDLIMWDGAPICDDLAFSTLLPNADAGRRMNRYIADLQAGSISQHVSGVFGCARVSPDGTCIIAPDPLSQYAIFFLKHGNTFLFSNSLHLIERAGQLLGIKPSRDFASNAFEAAFGVGGWTRTGLAGVHKIPPNHYVMHRQGATNFTAFRGAVTNSRTGHDQYRHHVSVAANSLKESAQAMSRTLPNGGLVLDLSGGKDTRLVLGAHLAANIRNFHVFLGGAANGPDQRAARQVARHFGLDRVQFLSNVEAGETISAIECARRAAYRSMGTSNQYQAALGRLKLAGSAQVRGGCSEGRTRAFFPSAGLKRRLKALHYATRFDPSSGRSDILRRLNSSLDALRQRPSQVLAALLTYRGGKAHKLFRPAFLHDAFNDIEQQVRWLQDLGVARKNLADAYYIFDRGWRHGGFPVQVTNDSRTTFEPLNNIGLVEAQFSLENKDRQKARLAFDLFDEFEVPDLVEMPFEANSWPEEFLSNSQLTRRAGLAQVSDVALPARPINQQVGSAHGVYHHRLVPYMLETQDYMLDLVSGVPVDHHCWDSVDRPALIQSIRSGELASQKLAPVGLRLLHAFIWLMHEESRVPLA